MHIPLEDGGHLLVMPKRQVSDRTKLCPVELLEIDYFSIMAAAVLGHFFKANWINYQENGNWGLDRPSSQHMHLHVYGRKRCSQTQIFGEALRFPPRAQKDLLSFPPFSERKVLQIQSWITSFRDSTIAAEFEKYIASQQKAQLPS